MEQWWYAAGGERAGPVNLDALRTLLRQGAIDTDTLTWRSGMAEWTRLADIAELGELHQPPPLGERAPPPVAQTGATTAGPWHRLVARSIDMLIVGIALNILGRSIGGHVGALYLTGIVAGLLITPAMLLVETVFFATTGWTPGKRLLGVAVRTLDGQRPDLRQYGRRMAGVWWFGLGAALPVINLIAMFLQFRHLRAGRTLVWDTGRFEVTASAPSLLRWLPALAAMVVLTLVYLVLVLAS